MIALPISKSTGVTYVGGPPAKVRYKIQRPVHSYTHINQNIVECNNLFSRLEIDYLSNLAASANLIRRDEPAYGFQAYECELAVLEKSILKKVSAVVEEANRRFFHFDLDKMQQPFIVSYLQQQDYSNKHNTIMTYPKKQGSDYYQEKLQLLIELSNPEERVGSEFIVDIFSMPQEVKTKKSSIYFLPTWTIKQFTPLKKGKHRLISIKICGPCFK